MEQIRYLSVRLEIKRPNGEHESIGSGVVWNPKGSTYSYILTAAHVVEPYLNEEVTFNVNYYDINKQQATISLNKENIALHPQYGSSKIDELKSNDVAVIQCNRLQIFSIDYMFYDSNELDEDSELVFYGFPKKYEWVGLSHNITRFTGFFQHTLNKEDFKYKLDQSNALDISDKNNDLLGVSGSGIFLNNHNKFILIGIHTNGFGENVNMNLVVGMNIDLIYVICVEKEWDIPKIEHHKPVKSGTLQIFAPSDFIQEHDSNDLAAPLDNNFYFREQEVIQLMSSIENHKVTMIYGQAGVGKTRIAVEVIKRFDALNKYRILCICSKDLPIFDDFKLNISTPGNYLIFIDDANELNNLHHILHFLNGSNEYHIKLIITVRDYAKQRLTEKIQEFTIDFKMIELKLFSNDEIELLMKENLNIKNSLFLNQICNIAKGNPRIAFLAGKLAKDKQSLRSIKNVSQLYKCYYSKYFNEMKSFENINLYLSAGIISLLKIINLEYIDRIEDLLSLFNISQEEFRENLYALHKMEFLSISFDKIAKISDQCLSNYLIYDIFFIKRPIPFSEIINIGFNSFRSDLIDSINILINLFHSEEVKTYLNEQINITWEIYKAENKQLFFQYVKVFHIFREEESLIYINQLISDMETDIVDLSKLCFKENKHYTNDEILTVLGNFSNSEYVVEAIETILIYYKKRPLTGGMITNLLINNYGLNHVSYTQNYNRVNEMLDILLNYFNTDELFELLFINIAEKLLQLNIELTNFKDNTCIFRTIAIKFTNNPQKYRSKLWIKITELSNYNKYKLKILNLLINYLNCLHKEVDTSVFEFDLYYVKNIVKNIQSINNLDVSKFFHKIINYSKDNMIEYDSIFETLIQNKEYELYLLLVGSYRKMCTNYTEYELIRKNNIKVYTQSLNICDLEPHSIIFNSILNQLPEEEYNITQGISIFIDSLKENKEKYLSFVQLCIEKVKFFRLFPTPIIQTLFSIIGIDATFKFINSFNFIQKNEWNFAFFKSLPAESINEYWTNAFLNYLKDDSDKFITQTPFRDLHFLDAYMTINPDIYIKAITIINEKFSYSSHIPLIYLSPFFWDHTTSPSTLLNIFNSDQNLLKEIYFKLLLNDTSVDYSGSFIKSFIERDKSWLNSYIKYVVENINRISDYETDRISACWSSPDYKIIFDEIFYQFNAINDSIFELAFKEFLINTFTSKEDDPIAYSNQLNWLKIIILKNHKNSKIYSIFDIISHLCDDTAIECVCYFLELNNDYNIFKKLNLREDYPRIWSGSLVPHYEQIIKFYESILPRIKGRDFLSHKKHIKEKIESLKKRIIKEQIDEIIEEKFH